MQKNISAKCAQACTFRVLFAFWTWVAQNRIGRVGENGYARLGEIAQMNLAEFEPLGDRILVRRHEEKESEGSIIIPDTAKIKATEGTVMACGPGAVTPETGRLVPMYLRPGDVILFGKYSGSEFEIGRDTLVMMREAEVHARLKRAPSAAAHGRGDLHADPPVGETKVLGREFRE